MEYRHRSIENEVKHTLDRGKSVLLLGARQTGKTTLTNRFKADLSLTLIEPDVRQRYERSPHQLKGEVDALDQKGVRGIPLVLIDEVQKAPGILDVVQDLIDRKKAKFILTGSSARKLRRGVETNLLPGRVVSFKMDPFSLSEFAPAQLEDALLYGSLPGIAAVRNKTDRETDLESYVTTYLEEEVRAEALVRNLGHFSRFLELAASESGNILNFRKLSQEIGVSHTTIDAYYQILQDCLIIERIEPITRSKTRKKLTKSHKFLFFDLGVRRLAAREGARLSRDTMGRLFEQFVGLELVRAGRAHKPAAKIKFWRDPDGPEVDWVIDIEGAFTPVEVKLTENPGKEDTRHIELFLSEYPPAKTGYIVCRVPRKIKLADNIYAWPWQHMNQLVEQ